jgi:hypothetical protein
MTTGGVGHPDWQSYSNWRGDFLYQNNAPMTEGANVLGSFVTTNWATLHVELFPSDQDATIIFEWYADSAGTEDIDTDSIDVPKDQTVNVLMPCKGNLCEISVFNNGNADATMLVAIEPTNLAVNRRVYLDAPLTLGSPNQTINHGVTQFLSTGSVVSGPAYLDYVPHSTAGNVTVDVFGANSTGGLEHRIASLGKPTGEVFRQMIVPECILTVRLINGSATVNEVYDLGVTVQSQ